MCKVNAQLQKKIAQAFSNDSEELQVFRRFCQRLDILFAKNYSKMGYFLVKLDSTNKKIQ